MASKLVNLLAEAIKKMPDDIIGKAVKETADGTGKILSRATAEELVEKLGKSQREMLEQRIDDIVEAVGEKEAKKYVSGFLDKVAGQEGMANKSFMDRFIAMRDRYDDKLFKSILDDPSIFSEDLAGKVSNFKEAARAAAEKKAFSDILSQTVDDYVSGQKKPRFRRTPSREKIMEASEKAFAGFTPEEISAMSLDKRNQMIDAALRGQRHSKSVEEYAIMRAQRQRGSLVQTRDEVISAINDKNTSFDKLKNLAEQLEYKFDPKAVQADMSAFRKNLAQHAKTRYNQQIADVSIEPDLGDYIGHYRVPQLAAGSLATAYVVSNMSKKRGRQSNAQLYGQQPPYSY